MIDWLQYSKTANFFRKRKNFSNALIERVLTEVRNNADSPSQNIFRHVRENSHGVIWSGISFFYRRAPSFLALPPDEARERVAGFILIVEHRSHVAVFRSHFEIPTELKTNYLSRVTDDRVNAVVAKADAVFQKINLRAMTSGLSLQSKILEAADLKSAVPPAGAGRFISRGYRVKRGADHTSAVPGTGRISTRSERLNYEALIQWAIGVIDLLNDEQAPPSDFIRLFARALDLASEGPNLVPTYVSFYLPGLRDAIYESADPVELVRLVDNDPVTLTVDEVNVFLDGIDRSFPVRKVKGECRIYDPDTNTRAGTLFIGKEHISLRQFWHASFDKIYVRPKVAMPGAEANDHMSLKTYIRTNDLLTVLFSDLAVVYLGGGLYRDEGLTGGGVTFMAYVRGNPRLNGVTSEKGTFTPAHAAFDDNSVFGAIIDSVSGTDDLVVCDDLSDEWADFIGTDSASQPAKLTFYHAKHGDLSLGAQSMHVLVAQAIKNLGHLVMTNDEITRKVASWAVTYTNRAATAIPRTIRRPQEPVGATLNRVNAAPDTIRRVMIVTSALSRQQLADKFAAISAGDAPEPHFVQLYWLLMSYFSACKEVNVFPYVVCRE